MSTESQASDFSFVSIFLQFLRTFTFQKLLPNMESATKQEFEPFRKKKNA